MDAIILQILNGLDKGSAYALIALGLTLIFGTLGVVNFAHGALFMIGAFCAVTLSKILSLSYVILDETQTDFLGKPLKVKVPYAESWFGPEIGGSDYRLVGTTGYFVLNPCYAGYWLHHGTRVDQTLLQKAPC